MRQILLILFLCAFTFHDGDTITQISYRLAYIDAPELNQTCHVKGVEIPIGKQSASYLEHISGGKIDDCRVIDIDRYGRAVADCSYNLKMVRRGYALCYDRYIQDEAVRFACHQAQDLAKAAKYGLWQCTDFVKPSMWREK